MTVFLDKDECPWEQCSDCGMAELLGPPGSVTLTSESTSRQSTCGRCRMAASAREVMKQELRMCRDAFAKEAKDAMEAREALAQARASREDALKIVTALEVALSDEEKLRRRLEKSCEAAERLAASHETEARVMRHERDTAQKLAETYLAERDELMRQNAELRHMLKETEISLDQARRQAWADAKRSAPHDEQESIQAKADADASTRAQQSSHPKNATGADVAAARRDTHTLWLASCEEAMAGKDWEGLRQLRSIGPLLISG